MVEYLINLKISMWLILILLSIYLVSEMQLCEGWDQSSSAASLPSQDFPAGNGQLLLTFQLLGRLSEVTKWQH